MSMQVSGRVAGITIGIVVAILAVVAWALFFRGGGSTPEELGIGEPAIPGGGTAPQGPSPSGQGN